MRTYQVFMKNGNARSVEVRADDVNLDCIENDADTAYWNFTARNDGGDDISVAVVPFGAVDYIASQP